MFGPDMYANFTDQTALMVSYYLMIVIIFFTLILLGKAKEGTKFTFVFLIAGLNLVSTIADVFFNSTFLC